MYGPQLYDVVQVRQDELIAQARRARLRREVSGPSLFHRCAYKWRRPATVPAPRPAQPVITANAR